MFKGWAVLSFLVLTVTSTHLIAQDASGPARSMVIQVKKSLPLTRSERPRKDYYLNVGAQQGVKSGWIYPVYRRAAIHDPFFNVSKGDLLVHVADLQVYHVEDQVSVAKVHGFTDPSSRPVLDEMAVMVGDAFDVSQGRSPAAASVGSAPVGSASTPATSPGRAAGLSPEQALKALEAYQKAAAPRQESPTEIPSGSLYVDEDPNLQAPVQVPQSL